jgi:hypothetical protein
LLDLIIYPFLARETVEPHCTIQIKINDDSSPIYTHIQNECTIFESDQYTDIAEILLSKICHQLADKSQCGVLFQAAGLSYRNQGILIPGGIGASKAH